MYTEMIAELAAADVIDAMTKRFAHRSHLIGLIGPASNKAIIGPAMTISFMPVRSDLMDPRKHSLGPAIYRAIGDANPKGAVLVMASNGHPHTSLGGSTKLSRLRNLDMAGIVCDGRLRDFEELDKYPFSSYCSGETIRAGGNEILPYLANVPVTLESAVTVTPGDIVFADPTGVAIVPPAEIEEILTSALEIKKMGEAMLDVIAKEDPQEIITKGSKEL